MVIGCRECGTRDVSGLDRRDGSEAIRAGMELPGVEEERSEFSRPKLTPEALKGPQLLQRSKHQSVRSGGGSAIKQPPSNAGAVEAALFVDGG